MSTPNKPTSTLLDDLITLGLLRGAPLAIGDRVKVLWPRHGSVAGVAIEEGRERFLVRFDDGTECVVDVSAVAKVDVIDALADLASDGGATT